MNAGVFFPLPPSFKFAQHQMRTQMFSCGFQMLQSNTHVLNKLWT